MAPRKTRVEEPEEYENPDRYLGSYADMITILLILFIVLFAFGQIDLAKFQEFKQGFARSGATPPAQSALLEGGQRVIEDQFEQALAIVTVEGTFRAGGRPNVGDGNELDGQGDGADAARTQLEDVQRAITGDLDSATIGTDVRFRLERRGLVISIVTDQVLFDPGSASLTAGGNEIVASLAASLGGLPNELSIEGHTDSRPISTARFPDNWELSVARASSVLRSLLDDYGVAPARVSASGYADTRPVASNETDVGRAANRRVEIVILSLAEATEPTFGEG